MTNKTNQFPVKFSMTATTKSDFMAAEDYLKTIGATKLRDRKSTRLNSSH